MSRARVTSRVGPLSGESSKCTSSATITVISFIQGARLRISESVFSEVATIISFLPSHSSLESRSPVETPACTSSSLNSLNRAYFSDASALNGTIYRHFPPLMMDLSMAISAIMVLPDAVGTAAKIFLPSSSPASTAFSWGG